MHPLTHLSNTTVSMPSALATGGTAYHPSGMSDAPLPVARGGLSPSQTPNTSNWVPPSSAVFRGPHGATWAHPHAPSQSQPLSQLQHPHVAWANTGHSSGLYPPSGPASAPPSEHNWGDRSSSALPWRQMDSAPPSSSHGLPVPGSWPSTVTPVATPRAEDRAPSAGGGTAAGTQRQPLQGHTVQQALLDYSRAETAQLGGQSAAQGGGVNPAAWRQGAPTPFAPEALTTGARATLNMSALGSAGGSMQGLMLSADEGARRSGTHHGSPATGSVGGGRTEPAGQPWWQSRSASAASSPGGDGGDVSPSLTAEGAAVAEARASLAASRARRMAVAAQWGGE